MHFNMRIEITTFEQFPQQYGGILHKIYHPKFDIIKVLT
jgi:hypothetical protein